MQLGDQAQDYAVAMQEMIDQQLPGLPQWYTLMYPTAAVSSPPAAPVGVTQQIPANTTDWASIVQALTQAGISAYQITQLTDLNRQLIASGRPPLTAAQAAAMAPQFNFGLTADTQNMLLFGALGIGAIILLSSVMKSRRT